MIKKSQVTINIFKNLFSAKNFKVIFVALFTVAAVACSFDSNRNENRADSEKRQENVESLSSITGVYEGTIRSPDQSEINAILSLTYREKVIGRDTDGQPIYRPVVSAKLIRPDLLVSNSTLEGRYIPENRDLTLSTETDGGEYFYLRGNINNNLYSGEIKTVSGTYGYFQLKFKTSSVPSGASDDYAQIERIRNRLRPLEGYYSVKITPEDRLDGKPYEQPYTSTITLRIENASYKGVPVNYPILIARYEHKAAGDYGPSFAQVNYKPEKAANGELLFASNDGPIRFSFKGRFLPEPKLVDKKTVAQQITGQILFNSYQANVETIDYVALKKN